MNIIAIKPKTVEAVPARMLAVTEITWRTFDDPFQRQLTVVVNGVMTFLIAGTDYDALGQWTDDTIQGLVLAQYGLEVIA